MRVPRKLSPSLSSVPLSSPPSLHSLRPPPLSSSLHLCCCRLRNPHTETLRLRRQPGTPTPATGTLSQRDHRHVIGKVR